MNPLILTFLLTAIALCLSGCGQESVTPSSKRSDTERPNILLIVADDLGYSDVGVFGSEISTPTVDGLAKEGIMLTQFHVAPNCGPTRGAMLTGVDPHRAGMGGNPEVAASNQKGKPGYEGHLREDVVTIAELLRDAGYKTYMTGKWHLGKGENDPASRGFNKTFSLLNGAASHWSDQGAIIPGAKTRYTRDGKIIDQLDDSFYSSAWYTDQLISFVDADKNDGAPFFAYLSFTAPHNPLHAPRAYIDKYRGRFDAGWDEIAAERLARLQNLGLVAKTLKPQSRPSWVMAWDELTPQQQAERSRDMEIYAGMIDYMDASIGRLFDHLRKSGQYENTLIVFISDNGPSRTSIQDYLALGSKGSEFFRQFDNSADNKGQPGSSTDIGPGWAFAAATPLRLFKGYVAQGGIQVPAVIKLPGQMPNAGSRADQLTHVMDLMPTFLSIAGVKYPDQYNGTAIVPLQGRSLMPVLKGEFSADEKPRALGWSAYGMDAYRVGTWKVLRLPEPYGNDDWQLYDLAADPGETKDLAAKHPKKTATLAKQWRSYASENGVIKPDTATAYAKPVVGQKY